MSRLREQITDFLDRVPRRYLDKFPGVKDDPQTAAQFMRERGRKAHIAKDYHPDQFLPGMHKEV